MEILINSRPATRVLAGVDGMTFREPPTYVTVMFAFVLFLAGSLLLLMPDAVAEAKGGGCRRGRELVEASCRECRVDTYKDFDGAHPCLPCEEGTSTHGRRGAVRCAERGERVPSVLANPLEALVAVSTKY